MQQQQQQESFVVVVVDIPIEEVGRVIGRNGATIRRLCDESNCKISIDTHTNPLKPFAKLTADSLSAIHAAKALIFEILHSTTVKMDYITHSLVSSGEFLSKLRSNHKNEKIEISGWDLKITGPSSQECEREIQQHISFLSAQHEEELLCPSIKAFQDDPFILELQTRFNLQIKIFKTDLLHQHKLKLSACRGVVDEALSIFKELFRGSSKQVVRLAPTVFANISEDKLNDFLMDLKEGVEDPFEVEVYLLLSSTAIYIEGRSAVTAKYELQQLLSYYFPDTCMVLKIPPQAVPYICGNNESLLFRWLRPNLQISFDPLNSVIWISGAPENALRCSSSIHASLQKCGETSC